MTARGSYSAHRRLALGAIAVAVSAVGLTGVTTSAVFTDTAPVTAGAFLSGTLNLSATPVAGALTLTTMAPNDKVTGWIVVNNWGNLALRYSVGSVTTGSAVLLPQLNLTVKSGISQANCTTALFAGLGTVVYGPGALGSAGGINIIGNPAVGPHAGDRTLAALSGETLCAQAELNGGLGATYQSLTTDTTFTFTAEQTINNP